MNYNQEDYKCDYVTLFIKDAANHPQSNLSTGVCVWDIPESSYYYKDRASITVMSVPSAGVSKLLLDDIVMMSSIGFNNSCSQLNSGAGDKLNTSLGVIGSFTGNNKISGTEAYEMRYINAGTIKSLVPAQPNQIEIRFIKDTKAVVDMSGDGERGHVVLKFSYHKPADYKPAENEFSVAFAPQTTF